MPTPCPAKHYVPPRRPFMSACASESVLRIRQAILRREKLSAGQRRRLQSLKPVRIALLFSMPDSSAERTPSAVDDSVSHCCPSMAFGALPFVMRGDTDIRVSQTATTTLRRRIMKTFQPSAWRSPAASSFLAHCGQRWPSGILRASVVHSCPDGQAKRWRAA